jgi:tRNA-2-methylthio-N6-dimethylallyladenosine synthase
MDEPARIGSLVDVHIDHAGPFALRGTPEDSLALV